MENMQEHFDKERIEAEGHTEDAGYLIPAMTEKEFQANSELLGDAMYNRIRLL